MIDVMMFLLIVSLVLALAAWTAEDGLRRAGAPTRLLWLVSLVAPLFLLALPALLPGGTALGPVAGAVPVIELAPLVLAPGEGSGLAGLGTLLAAMWLLGSVALAGLLVHTHGTLSAERSRWPKASVSGSDVYLSTDRGPAVAGVLRPWIVLPRWALDLPDPELGLVVLHEREHVRGRDSLLLAAALALLVLTPWNPVSWWQLRRLRTSMEVDCDRRVLKRTPDRKLYGSSLISVAERASGRSLGLAAFTEKSLSLETRIIAMTPITSRWTRVRAAAFLALASLVGIQACGVETPVGSDGSELRPATETEAATDPQEDLPAGLDATPEFTPFTVAPVIANRQEVVTALESAYPPLLRDAGIGGRVVVWFYINELGQIDDTRIAESSGHPALDDAALRVASVYEFTPARNREEPVPVWVSFPITFQRH